MKKQGDCRASHFPIPKIMGTGCAAARAITPDSGRMIYREKEEEERLQLSHYCDVVGNEKFQRQQSANQNCSSVVVAYYYGTHRHPRTERGHDIRRRSPLYFGGNRHNPQRRRLEKK